MKFRKSGIKDISNIIKIINQAQEYFKLQGIDQWQNGYPNQETIENDIKNDESYVLEKGGDVIATTMISFNGESTYNSIQGNWISNNDKYATIHRLAVDNSYKGNGISSKIIKHIETYCLNKGIKSIRVDTHEDNISMQRLLEKNNFKYCGVIYLEDNSKRIAFEKLI